MSRHPGRVNQQWETPKNDLNWEHVCVEVLMDIRTELHIIKNILSCYRIPKALDATVRIDKRLAKRISLKEKSK